MKINTILKQNVPIIVGGGIGGPALSVTLKSLYGIDSLVLEKDVDREARSQGYGLTLQQGRQSTSALGIDVSEGISSSSHYVFNPSGDIISCFGRALTVGDSNRGKGRPNVHIPRNTLRQKLLSRMGNDDIAWGVEYLGYEELDGEVLVSVKTKEGEEQVISTPLLVGADGIHSKVRKQKIGDPLNALSVMVILGISNAFDHPLLKHRVFQTVDGHTRWYSMPFDHSLRSSVDPSCSPLYMWQLSFPLPEEEALKVVYDCSNPTRFLDVARERCSHWHDPIPTLIESTELKNVSGYPIYDRNEIALSDFRQGKSRVTFLGDAAHPMSPFKGQGANQALLDARALGKALDASLNSNRYSMDDALMMYEEEMMIRGGLKVAESRRMSSLLHGVQATQSFTKGFHGEGSGSYHDGVSDHTGSNSGIHARKDLYTLKAGKVLFQDIDSAMERLKVRGVNAFSKGDLDHLVIQALKSGGDSVTIDTSGFRKARMEI
jgi:salicylate hydroxylase